MARSVLQCWSVTSDFCNNDLFDVSGFSTVCCYVTNVAGVLFGGNKTLCLFLCFAVNGRLLMTFSNACSSEVFHVALFATVVFPCSIQYSSLLVHFEKKTQFIFVSIWLYRDFIWVPTQPTLVWSWADAHATDTIAIERGFTTSGMQLGTLVM